MGRRYDPAKISGAPHKSTSGAGGPFTENTAKGSGIAGPGTNSRPRQSYSYRSAPNDPPPRGLGRKAGTTAGTSESGTWRWIMFEHSLIDLEAKTLPRRRW